MFSKNTMKPLLLLPLLLIVVLVPVAAYAEEFTIEFSDSTSFVKGDFVGIIGNGVNFDSSDKVTGVVLDNSGSQIDVFQSEISRFTDVGDVSQGIIKTDNSKYQSDIFYTVITTYQGQESQLQFTLTPTPPTMEELSVMIQSQQQSSGSEMKILRAENAEFRQQITTLTERIDALTLIIQEQISVMMTFFQ